MNYCAVNEAFDNSLRRQMADYEKNNNIYKKQLQQEVEKKTNNNNLIPPNTFDNYTDLEINPSRGGEPENPIIQYPNIYPAFFTAQGDYSSKGPYFSGTQIGDLQTENDNNEFNMEEISMLDSYSDDSLPSIKPKNYKKNKKAKDLDHQYCIDKIVKTLIDEPDAVSLASSIDDIDLVYKHIKSCSYCKSKINKNIKNQCQLSGYAQDIKNSLTGKNPYELRECFDTSQNMGYGLKELLIIILAGVVLVFILDLLVKIGKKLNK